MSIQRFHVGKRLSEIAIHQAQYILPGKSLSKRMPILWLRPKKCSVT